MSPKPASMSEEEAAGQNVKGCRSFNREAAPSVPLFRRTYVGVWGQSPNYSSLAGEVAVIIDVPNLINEMNDSKNRIRKTPEKISSGGD